MYTLCVYVPPKRTLINPLSVQADQAVGSSRKFPSGPSDQAYYAKVSAFGSQTDPNKMRRAVVHKGNSNERSLAKIVEEKELLTQEICENLVQYHEVMARYDQELTCLGQQPSRIGSKFPKEDNCATHVHTSNVPKRVPVSVNVVVNGPKGPGLHFLGQGSFARHAQDKMNKISRQDCTVQQFMLDLQKHPLISQAHGQTLAQGSSRTVQQWYSNTSRQHGDLPKILRSALMLCDNGFQSVKDNHSLVIQDSNCCCGKLLGVRHFRRNKWIEIESEKRFLLNHLFAWLKLKCLMTDSNFGDIIPAAWLAPQTEDCQTSVVNGTKKQKTKKDSTNKKIIEDVTLKTMSTMFHAGVIALKNPIEMVNHLRTLMRHFLVMSMPLKRAGLPVHLTDLQKCALQCSASDHKFFKKTLDPWLQTFKAQDGKSTLGENGDRKPVRGTAWPGDISSSVLPTVLVALLLMLYKGHILLLNEFKPDPENSVPEIFEAIRQRLDNEQKEATYQNLNLHKIMQSMDVEVCFLFVTYSWCRHTSKET